MTGSTQSPHSISTKTSAAQYFLKGVRRNVADCTKFKECNSWKTPMKTIVNPWQDADFKTIPFCECSLED
jgi:hypothetical protein